jgi:hypothetical protein
MVKLPPFGTKAHVTATFQGFWAKPGTPYRIAPKSIAGPAWEAATRFMRMLA